MVSLPQTITVQKLIESRYSSDNKPLSWDERVSGFDVVESDSGEQFKLLSSGGQAPPKPGWKIVMTSGDGQNGYQWTLYGLARTAAVH